MTHMKSEPTEEQVQKFVQKLRGYRDTLPEDEQCLLNAMYFAAMGQQGQKDEDTQSYWVAAGPYRPHGWAGRPWGAAYGFYYR